MRKGTAAELAIDCRVVTGSQRARPATDRARQIVGPAKQQQQWIDRSLTLGGRYTCATLSHCRPMSTCLRHTSTRDPNPVQFPTTFNALYCRPTAWIAANAHRPKSSFYLRRPPQRNGEKDYVSESHCLSVAFNVHYVRQQWAVVINAF